MCEVRDTCTSNNLVKYQKCHQPTDIYIQTFSHELATSLRRTSEICTCAWASRAFRPTNRNRRLTSGIQPVLIHGSLRSLTLKVLKGWQRARHLLKVLHLTHAHLRVHLLSLLHMCISLRARDEGYLGCSTLCGTTWHPAHIAALHLHI